MKRLTILWVLIFLFTGYNQCISQEKSMPPSNKEKVAAFLKSIETGDPEPINYVNSDKYIQHNLLVGDGLQGFAKVMEQLPKGSAKANVVRVFQDGDYIFTHTEYNFFGPKIGFDIFKFENGKIVEHWDNLQVTVKETASGRTQIDGPTQAKDLNKTQENKQLIAKFMEDILKGKNPGKITDYISTEKYYQHTPSVPDGLNELGKALQGMAKAGMPMMYTKNHMILGEGNFVLAVSEGQFLNKHVSFYDLFRIEGGKLVEHWDVIEEIPPRKDWKHNNGKF